MINSYVIIVLIQLFKRLLYMKFLDKSETNSIFYNILKN